MSLLHHMASEGGVVYMTIFHTRCTKNRMEWGYAAIYILTCGQMKCLSVRMLSKRGGILYTGYRQLIF